LEAQIYYSAEIPVNGIFNERESLWFLNRGYDDCMYRVFTDKIRRAIRYDNELMLVDIYPSPQRINICWLIAKPSEKAIAYVLDFVVNWFDLEADLNRFYYLLAKHPSLSYMAVKYNGLRFMGMPDLFEAIAWCIIGQQINLTFAYKIKRKLVERFGEKISYDGEYYHLFPSAGAIVNAGIEELRAMQFSEKKAEYLINIAHEFKAERLTKEILRTLPDLTHRLKFLTSIRGIGSWTANYVLMKSLKEPSGIPLGDAGLLNALIKHDLIRDKNDIEGMMSIFSRFKGWESYLVFYLWRSLAPMPEAEN